MAIGVAAAAGAWADNPVNGASLFAADCASCHGNSPLTSNSNKIYNGRNARSVIDAAISNVGQMNGLRSRYPQGGTALADLAAYLGETPNALAFGSTNVGATSTAQTVTIYASLKSGNGLSSLSVATTGDFARTGGTCGASLAVGTSCTIQVSFTPTAGGTRTGSLSVTSNQSMTPVVLALSGTGVVTATPGASIAPSALSFGSIAIGNTSSAQNVTVSNTGNAPLTISSFAVSDPANFLISGGTCTNGGTVAAAGSCTVAVAFKPTGSAGARSASLSIVHNAAGSPGAVSLSGTAATAPAPVAGLTTSLSFGSVTVATSGATQTATLTNSGTAVLTIGTIATGSAEFAVVAGGTCVAGGSVAVGGSCTMALRFTPSVAGARSATLTVTHNAAGGQSTTALSGTGVAATPAASVSPTQLSFTQTVGGTSAAQTVTLSNTGTASLNVSSIGISGAQATEFAMASGGSCAAPGSVAANSSCTLNITFTPSASGARSASLTIAHNAAGSPTQVALTGTGTASPQPSISLSAASLAFGSQTVTSTGAVRSVTVVNSGAAALTFSGFSLTGTQSADFARSGTCTPTGTLAVGASCTVAFAFTPAATGSRSATFTIASNAVNGSASISLSGTGTALAVPAVGLSATTVDFGNQTVKTPSSVRTVTLSNTGTGSLNLSSIAASGDFGVIHTCGLSVAAGASCTLSITFTPSVVGVSGGALTIASDAASSPNTVALTGTAVVASAALAWSPSTAAVDFGTVGVGAAPAAANLTLVNQGPGSATLAQLILAGAQANEFAFGSGSTCAASTVLASGASCVVALTFQPGAAGNRTAALQVQSSGTNPNDVSLTGTGSALAQSTIVVVPSPMSFTAPLDSSAAVSQTVVIENNGNSSSRVTAIRVTAGSFTVVSAASNGCPTTPFDLLPGASCAVTVTWSGGGANETGTLEVDAGATSAAAQVTIHAIKQSVNVTQAMSNVGAGGCSIVRSTRLIDPTLILLALAAVGVLLVRRIRKKAR